MNTYPKDRLASAFQGQFMRLSERHQVAIYLREGVSWVAEFRDGRGALTDAATWFRFHTGALRYSHSRRAAALQSATALTLEVIHKIEHLHRSFDANDAKRENARVVVLESVNRYCRAIDSRMLGRASKSAERLN